MLTYLIPFIAVLTRVQATDFHGTIIVDIKTIDPTDKYTYQDITLYDLPGEKAQKSNSNGNTPGIMGQLYFYESDDVRAFRWKKDEDGMEYKQVSLFLNALIGR